MTWIRDSTPVNAIRTTTERMLWHQRLGHPSDQYLYTAHKFIDGVPTFKHFDPVLERCPTCIRSEQPKTPSTGTTKQASRPWQGFAIDLGFPGQSRKDSSAYTEFVGLHGEKCWLIIKDLFSGIVIGDTFKSKAAPLNTLRNFLATFCPESSAHLNRFVHMDNGGEL